jgi:Uma2 family endonuclease
MATPQPHRISADEYYRMAELNLFEPDARIELIEGVIIDMAPIGNPHMSAVDRLTKMLIEAVGERAIVRCQGSIRISDFSVPEPDFALLKPRADFYKNHTATSEDVLLMIEVSESSLRFDLAKKAPLYAKHGVPELWVVDVQGRRVHFFRSLEAKKYRDISVSIAPTHAAIGALPDVTLDLSFLRKF